MKEENFISLLLGTAGAALFGIGMCMVLLPEWDMFREGIFFGLAGLIVWIILIAVRRRMMGKPAMQLSMRTVGIWMFGIASALLLGVGMCMCMVWEGLLLPGILVGLAGILMLICLSPLCKGLK